MEDLRKMLGKPLRVVRYELKKETYYSWRYLTDQNNTSMIFSAVLNDDMRVLRTETMADADSASNGAAGGR
jgi:hypothetical protein